MSIQNTDEIDLLQLEIGSYDGSRARQPNRLTMNSNTAAMMKMMRIRTERRKKPSKSDYTPFKKFLRVYKTQSADWLHWAKALKSKGN